MGDRRYKRDDEHRRLQHNRERTQSPGNDLRPNYRQDRNYNSNNQRHDPRRDDRDFRPGPGDYGGFGDESERGRGRTRPGDYDDNYGDQRGGYNNRGGYRGGHNTDRGGRGGRGNFNSGNQRNFSGRNGPSRSRNSPGDPEGHLALPQLPTRVSIPVGALDVAKSNPPPVSAGRVGRHIKVKTNHYEIASLPRGQIHMYDVTVKTGLGSEDKKELTEKALPRIWLNPVLQNVVQKIFKESTGAIWDGVSIIYSMNPLDLSSDPAILDIEERGRIWQISIKKRQNINFQDLLAFVYSNAQKKEKDGAVSKSTEAHQCMIFLNALLRNDPLKRFQTGQGSKSTTYFDQNNSNLRQRLGFNSMLDACSGVYQSASLRFGRLTVNVDIATAIYIQPGAPLIQYVAALCGRDVRPKDLQNYFDRQGPAVTDLILQKLRSIGFRTKHLKRDKMADSYNRYFTDYVFRCNPREDADNYMFNQKITAIGDDGKPYQTFKKTSVTKYYEETYNIKLQYPNLPLVEARGQRGARWPMELLFIDQAERYKPLLLGEETAEFLKHATSKPSDRLTKIHRNVARLAWHENKDLQNFKVAISAQPIECAARILPTPKITYAENFELDPSRGRWNLRGQHGRAPPQFIKPKALNLWAIVYFSAPGHNSRSPSTQAVELIEQNFARVMRNHGIPTGPLGGIHQMNTQGDFKEVIREIMNQVHAKHGKWPCMLVFILPSDSTQLYGLIKYACEVYIGIASQCLVAPKVNGQKHLDMYLSNVAMKINAKLGGSSANVRDPWFESHPTMILGADMSRPIHTDGGASSFVAVAGSFDTLCQRYTVVTQLQTGEDGIILDFKNMSTILTERYMNRGTAPPKHIIYFRDGISEDRYQTVLEKELKALKEFLPKCLVTVIICAKRHHTRLFPTGYGEGDQNGNVLPGTVVENRADGQDIFLVPHVGLQGTVRPTRYISIHDENNLSPDNFQRICNNLSYSYARATCAVSTIPAVYYAGLACSRAKDHLNADGKLQQVNGRLQWSMWWQ